MSVLLFFLFWGNGIPKIRTFDIGRIKEEIDWAADRKISYVFGADANFGMMPRDKDIAELFVAKKNSVAIRALSGCVTEKTRQTGSLK